MSISTHVLDATTGKPAVGVTVRHEVRIVERWTPTDDIHVTDADGRIADLAPASPAGFHRLVFDVDAYFAGATFYPEVVVTFRIVDAQAHHHVPLLLSPYAYSTYRGS